MREQRLEKLKQLQLVDAETTIHPVLARTPFWENLTQEQRDKSSRIMEVYAAMVDRMDQNVGRVVEYLKDRGELDNTIVIFLSDNGAEGAQLEALPVFGGQLNEIIEQYYDNSIDNIGRANSYVWYGEHWAQAATAPARLYKAHTSEGGIRTVSFIHYAGFKRQKSDQSRVSDSHGFTTNPVRLFKYSASWSGCIKVVNWYHCVVVLSCRIYKYNKITFTVKIMSQAGSYLGKRLCAKGEWKALFIPAPNGPNRWQLYNLKDDKGETQDLAKQYPEKLDELLKEWATYVKENGVIENVQQRRLLQNDQLEPFEA